MADPSRPLVMGILNVTPDSFSDGGRFLDLDAAVAHGLEMVAEGADLVDIGGESTRPGADPVDLDTELARVVPAVAALAPHVRISVDTTKPEVARAAVEAGATLINDVACTLDGVAAELGVGWVAMHSRGDPRTMQSMTDYDDVVDEVVGFLAAAAERATARGVDEIWVDPGIGFAKTAEQNWQLIAHLDRLVDTGLPVLVGTSRKGFLGAVLGASDRVGREHGDAACRTSGQLDDVPRPPDGPAPFDDRLEGSVATVTWALAKGARMVRVHDVRASARAVTVVRGRP